MSSQLSDLKQEGMDTKVLSVENQASIDCTVGAGLCQGSGPPFHRIEGRCVDLEFVSLWDECGRGLELSQVASMGEFGLNITKRGRDNRLVGLVNVALVFGSDERFQTYHPKIS